MSVFPFVLPGGRHSARAGSGRNHKNPSHVQMHWFDHIAHYWSCFTKGWRQYCETLWVKYCILFSLKRWQHFKNSGLLLHVPPEWIAAATMLTTIRQSHYCQIAYSLNTNLWTCESFFNFRNHRRQAQQVVQHQLCNQRSWTTRISWRISWLIRSCILFFLPFSTFYPQLVAFFPTLVTFFPDPFWTLNPKPLTLNPKP